MCEKYNNFYGKFLFEEYLQKITDTVCAIKSYVLIQFQILYEGGNGVVPVVLKIASKREAYKILDLYYKMATILFRTLKTQTALRGTG